MIPLIHPENVFEGDGAHYVHGTSAVSHVNFAAKLLLKIFKKLAA